MRFLKHTSKSNRLETNRFLFFFEPFLVSLFHWEVIWKKSVKIDSKWNVDIEILRGQEPATVIYSALRPHGVPYTERRKIFQQAIEDGVPYSIDATLLFSKNITLKQDENDDGGPLSPGLLTLYDNGEEPVDVLYDFAKKNSITDQFDRLSDVLLPKLCELVICTRNRPRIWKNSIQSDGKQELGTLEIFGGDEPVDAIDVFLRGVTVDIKNRHAFRQNLLGIVCQSIPCSRSLPVIYRKTITDENGTRLGEMTILEDEEAIDAAVRFIRKLNGTNIDEIALKNYVLGDACGINRIKCTRNVAIIFKRLFREEDDSPIGTLVVFENEEPADKVYQWCMDNHLDMGYFRNILDIVCDSDLVMCRRRDPISLAIPMRGPEGEFINTFEIKVGQEPVDALFGFFSANGLFQKNWDFHGVLHQICAMDMVNCKRNKALKHYDGNFTMGKVSVGPLVIWEDQEVIDVLYSIRQDYNLTEEHQMTSFIEICKKPEVPCDRSKAKIFEKTEITKLDYEKFGNETCARQFVGLKFRSSFVNMPMGTMLSDFLKREKVQMVRLKTF